MLYIVHVYFHRQKVVKNNSDREKIIMPVKHFKFVTDCAWNILKNA